LLGDLHRHGRQLGPEVSARLERYGLTTLGHLARIPEAALRTQFGAAGGSLLAALACGRDTHPLSPTPPAARIRVRAAFPTAIDDTQLFVLMPLLARRVARHLLYCRQVVGTLTLALVGGQGSVVGTRVARVTLGQPVGEAWQLTQHLRRLLLRAIERQSTQEGTLATPATAAFPAKQWETLVLTLSHVTPVVPTPAALWPDHPASHGRERAIEDAAERLARRYGYSGRSGWPFLARIQKTAPVALFAEERYTFALLDDDPIAAAHGKRAELRESQPTRKARERRETWSAHEGTWQRIPLQIHWW
jgi:nucleotidyltransferase/DNA polymerase involved in DNA repair